MYPRRGVTRCAASGGSSPSLNVHVFANPAVASFITVTSFVALLRHGLRGCDLIGSQHPRYTKHIVGGRRELADITSVKAT
jgi:hypothetical protein